MPKSQHPHSWLRMIQTKQKGGIRVFQKLKYRFQNDSLHVKNTLSTYKDKGRNSFSKFLYQKKTCIIQTQKVSITEQRCITVSNLVIFTLVDSFWNTA